MGALLTMITIRVKFAGDKLFSFATSDTCWSEPSGEPLTDDYYCETERDAERLINACESSPAVISYERIGYPG
jgi:hypothetical protein